MRTPIFYKAARIARHIAILCLCPVILSGCGGGGGGGGASGPADISIDINPHSIDTADKTRVTVNVSEVDPNGIALKIRFPSAMNFVRGSSFITVDGESSVVSPTVAVSADTVKYLVFFIPRVDFGEGNEAQVKFELEGRKPVASGVIEIDADVDDPKIPNSTEFNVASPRFSAIDSADIEIKG